MIHRLVKYHRLLKQHFPQYKVDGTRNIWIVKPSYNARGFGIYCIDSVKDLFTGTGSRKVQNKVIQKYLERPFLLQVPTT